MSKVINDEIIALVEKAFKNSEASFRVFSRNKVEMTIPYIRISKEHEFGDFNYHLKNGLKVFHKGLFGIAKGECFLILNAEDYKGLLDKVLNQMNNELVDSIGTTLIYDLIDVLTSAAAGEFEKALNIQLSTSEPQYFEKSKSELISLLNNSANSWSEKGEYLTVGINFKVHAEQPIDLTYVWFLSKGFMKRTTKSEYLN
jgi:hypothetical protein